jgi:aminoglycoside 6-adenylyltransferase
VLEPVTYDFGDLLVRYRHPIRTLGGHRRFASITQYANWLKIDFTVMDVGYLQAIAALPQMPADLDIGYAVLLDKDDLTADLATPTYQAYILEPPTETAYLENIENFLHETTYVAKNLWRDELLPAKHSFDTVMKGEYLRQMLEWHIALAHDWTWKPGVLGKGLKRDLRTDYWQRLASTYIGADADANWQALFETIALFRDAAAEVGAGLGYTYPAASHQRIVADLRMVKGLDQTNR